jgi:nicotinate-nucleotide adenylyltransferase
MRICIFGGSFDPVHYGHLLMAETAREQLSLDRLLFMPAAIAPHKKQRPQAADKHRVEMLNLALAGHPQLLVSTLEIDRQGVSYTVDTLRAMRAEHPGAELFFLMGADSLVDLPTWREPQAVCELAILAVVRRLGAPPPDFSGLAGIVAPERIALFERHEVEMPLIELRSTELRQRVAAGRSIRYRTPRAVEKYIQTHRLYGGRQEEE